MVLSSTRTKYQSTLGLEKVVSYTVFNIDSVLNTLIKNYSSRKKHLTFEVFTSLTHITDTRNRDHGSFNSIYYSLITYSLTLFVIVRMKLGTLQDPGNRTGSRSLYLL